jgi:hypothetical protein
MIAAASSSRSATFSIGRSPNEWRRFPGLGRGGRKPRAKRINLRHTAIRPGQRKTVPFPASSSRSGAFPASPGRTPRVDTVACRSGRLRNHYRSCRVRSRPAVCPARIRASPKLCPMRPCSRKIDICSSGGRELNSPLRRSGYQTAPWRSRFRHDPTRTAQQPLLCTVKTQECQGLWNR